MPIRSMTAYAAGERNTELWSYIPPAAIAVIVVSYLFLRPDPPEEAIDTTPRVEATVPTATATPTPAKPKKTRSTDAATAATPIPTDSISSLFGDKLGGLGVPGIPGSGTNFSQLPTHKLTITLSTKGTLGQIAWIIPTSADKSQGNAVIRGGSWSLTTTVYGNPDYAVAFAQQSSEDNPVNCRMTIDGRQTENRSTTGIYTAMWCQG